MDIYHCLCDIGGGALIRTGEPMKKHTTFRVGGEAEYFFTPTSYEQVSEGIAFCKREGIPFHVIGNGSNLLVSDKGLPGVVLQIGRSLSDVAVDGRIITAQAGASLSKVAKEAAAHNLTGLEFAAGIPGTLGGGVTMNAGAYGGEMADVILSADILRDDGEITALTGEDLELGYRTSSILRMGAVVLGARLELQPGKQGEILQRMKELSILRKEKQPLEYPSGGSTFKRPAGHFAGKLIMDAGLRGYTVGQAAVSEKHCGFIINKGGATAADIHSLCKHVEAVVFDRFGVRLEMEVKMLGEF